jgi:outer membrane protein, multidrug efflux system
MRMSELHSSPKRARALNRAASLAMSALLAACAAPAAPPGAAPSTPARFDQADASAQPNWPKPDWWLGFGSPELDRLMARAETDSFDIQAAIARIRQADAQLKISGAPLLPSVTGSAQTKWERGYVAPTAVSRGVYVENRSATLGPTASYDLDLWGKIAAQRDSALASAVFSRADRDNVALDTLASIATTWFAALADQDRIAVANRNLSDAEEILRAIQAREDAGTASDLDVSQQAALVAGVRATIPALRSDMIANLDALGVLVGATPEELKLRPTSLIGLSLPEVAPGLPSALLRRRPDVMSAEAQLEAAKANIEAARAALYPDVSLTGSGGWTNTGLATLFGPTSLFASAAASATQTIFDNGSLTATVELDVARRDELVADYRKAIVQAFTDVENALAQYREATDQEKLETDAVTVAQRAADIARAQVLAGTSDIVTALQTQQTLFTDLDALAQVRLTRFNALVALYKALGGGWTVERVVPPETHLFNGVL